MRCYLFHKNRIATVAILIPGPDDDLIRQGEEIFRKHAGRFGAFEIWDRDRFVYRYPDDDDPRRRRRGNGSDHESKLGQTNETSGIGHKLR